MTKKISIISPTIAPAYAHAIYKRRRVLEVSKVLRKFFDEFYSKLNSSSANSIENLLVLMEAEASHLNDSINLIRELDK